MTAAVRTGIAAAAAALALGALGVVFGDIGTSPLYSIQTVFTADHARVQTDPVEVYGVISLVFWAITLIVSIKYVAFILRADNDGEGGIMALTALLQKNPLKTRKGKAALVALGVFGASLFYGDGIITPAISVLSAVEGVKVAAPGLGHLVLPITVTVLTVLFVIQRYGTGVVGRLFGPVMLAVVRRPRRWPASTESAKDPAILKALSPSYGARVHPHPRRDRLHRAGLGRARRHRRRGAVRRHGPLRPTADHPGLVLRRVPRPDPELPRPGGADPPDADCDLQPVLPDPARAGSQIPMVRAGDGGHRDRLAVGDLGRVQRDPPSRAAGLPAADDDPAHLRARRSARSTPRRSTGASTSP